jgi:glycosyltransferase involved in cell wall biosynthesis
MTEPLVSIITPTYNHEHFIGDCILSVLQQSWQNWQMIIVDDGSSDRTAEIVRSFSSQEPRILFLQQENVGVFRLSETYNKALARCQGSYIAILEGDDFWQPDKLQRQVAALESHPECVLAWGKAQVVNRDRSKILRHLPEEEPQAKPYYRNAPVGSFLNILLYVNCIPAMTLLIRRQALQQIGGFVQSHQLPLVDIPTLMKLTLLGEFYYDPLALGAWRHYIGQTTKTYLADSLEKAGLLSLQFYQHLDPEMASRLKVTKSSIKKYFHSAVQIAHSRMGRYKLMQKDWPGARRDYLIALFYRGAGNPLWRLRSLIGYLFSWLKWDVETLSRLLGKPSYKP